MNIQFKNTAYLAAIKQHTNLTSNERIFNFAKRNPVPVTINFARFSSQYHTPALFPKLGKKIIALPAAIWYGCVKTIYHLAILLFFEIKKKVSSLNPNETQTLLAEKFYIKNDIKKSFGWLLTLFRDQAGAYIIQSSQFQRSYYACTISNHAHYPVRRKPVLDYYWAWSEQELDNEAERLKQLTGTDPSYVDREDMYESLISNYILNNCTEKAASIFYKLTIKPNSLIKQIAEAYFSQSNFQRALTIINKFNIADGESFSIRENFKIKVAEACLKANKFVLAKLAVEDILDLSQTRRVNSLKIQVLEKLYADKDYKNAWEMVRNGIPISPFSEGATTRLPEIAEGLYANGDLIEAAEAAEKLTVDIYPRRNDLLFLIAQSLFTQGDRISACNILMLNSIPNDRGDFQVLVHQVAMSYHQEGLEHQRNLMIKRMTQVNRDNCLIDLGIDYLKLGVGAKAYQMINACCEENKQFNVLARLAKLYGITDNVIPILEVLIIVFLNDSNECFKHGLFIEEYRHLGKKYLTNLAKKYFNECKSSSEQRENHCTSSHLGRHLRVYLDAIKAAEDKPKPKAQASDDWSQEFADAINGNRFSGNRSGIRIERIGDRPKRETSSGQRTNPQARSSNGPDPNNYVILGVTQEASWEDVKKAYRNLARVIHPDKIPKQGQCPLPERNKGEKEHAYHMRCAGIKNETEEAYKIRHDAASAKFIEVDKAYKELEKHLAPK